MTTSPSATIVSWLCIATTLPYAHAIATGYGEVHLQIPVFRCGQCRRMAGGMTLLGQEMRYQRFSKKTVMPPSAALPFNRRPRLMPLPPPLQYPAGKTPLQS